jgi:8-oxo-dGTP pyrophosphatase MutT (NUDIX family)
MAVDRTRAEPVDLRPLHAAAVSLLTSWAAPSIEQEQLRAAYLGFLEEHSDGVSRRQRRGHLTASALIVDPLAGAVLLTLHPLVGRWLQTGGHCEASDLDLTAAALREAVEEGGVADLIIDAVPLQLDRHRVACKDADGGLTMLNHLDVQFLVMAPSGATPRRSEESLDLRWWSWDALPAGTDDSVRHLVAAARTRLALE